MTMPEGKIPATLNSERYSVRAVESKWQKIWADSRLYERYDMSKPKFYCLEQFPYPSGHLHMGHVRVYTLGDVVARFRRMAGFNVLHPMGWDAFGMPAENAAIKSGVPPQDSTRANIAYMKQQMQQMGLSFDWSREVTTSEPDYYHFTQQLFLLFFQRQLAYQKKGAVNWCPTCETVLANEQVEDGLCWRCESVVVKRDLTQWYFHITGYAEQLLKGLEGLDWPQEIKTQQFNWIGKSTGAEIIFDVPEFSEQIAVFTTRPDTLFGATYLVLAPEHPLVPALIAQYSEAARVQEFIDAERLHSDMERTAENTEKRGIFTGASARHPLSGERIPIWIANYVLGDYGTGAVMGVPAHDERDFLFARKYRLPVKTVVQPKDSAPQDAGAYTGAGTLVESGPFTGMGSQKARSAISEALQEIHKGGPRVSYRMRDWLISRQRYWGAPIPIIHCPRCGAVPVPLSDLPVLLPEDVAFTGKGASPLASADSWIVTPCPVCGGEARRETDTMDTFVDSSWYYYRYTSLDSQEPFRLEDVKYWMPVDEYVGGKEHAVLHLLYSRFFTKVLYDAGLTAADEPFLHLLSQGMVIYGGKKMSKSKGNTLSPEKIMDEWGSDATRVFMLFAAPPDKDFEWSQEGVEGAYRFLQRVYRLVVRHVAAGRQEQMGEEAGQRVFKALHRAVKKVTADIGERRAFNTAISTLMELTNVLYQDLTGLSVREQTEVLGTLVRLLAPFAPHLSEELWALLGHSGSVHEQPWPQYEEKWLTDDAVTIALQVNGKVRSRITVPTGADADELSALALKDGKIRESIAGKTVMKVVAVPGRLVNVVVR